MKRPIIKANTFRAFSYLLGASTLFMAGCAAHTTEPIKVEPEALVITPDEENDIDLNVSFNIPPHYISSRSMAVIEPVLILGDSIVERYEPYVIRGTKYVKKEERLEKLYGIKPAYGNQVKTIYDNNQWVNIPLSEEINIGQDFDSGRIEAYVIQEGCGECYGVDTIEVAYLSNLSSLIDLSGMMVQWIDTVPPDSVKQFSDRKEARLQFQLDRSEIIPAMANNAAELESMLVALTPVLKDSLSTLNKLSIFGSASAEGGYDHNVKLAKSRANSAKEWIDSKLHMTPTQKRMVTIGSEPEGWWPVVASMHAAGDPDSIKVKRIIEKYPDVRKSDAEKAIRKLDCWPRIAEHHLAKDRKVTFMYEWTIKSFERPEEALAMYQSRPEMLNEIEYLRAATLLKDDNDALIKLYETFAANKPYSEIAINNLAALYYENGQYEDAIKLLQKQKKPTEKMNSTLAMCYIKLGDEKKAMEVLKGLNNDNATHTLGVLQARNHMMADAYNNLKGTPDLNAAISALGVNKNNEAWEILNALDDKSCKADYIRAIAKVRLGDTEQALKYLKHATQDPQLKQRAASEADFKPLRKEWKFKQYTGQ